MSWNMRFCAIFWAKIFIRAILYAFSISALKRLYQITSLVDLNVCKISENCFIFLFKTFELNQYRMYKFHMEYKEINLHEFLWNPFPCSTWNVSQIQDTNVFWYFILLSLSCFELIFIYLQVEINSLRPQKK